MHFGGELSIDKVCGIRQNSITRLIDIVVENGGCELELTLKKEQLKELRNKIIEFCDEKTNQERFFEWFERKPGNYAKNKAGFLDVFISTDDEENSICMRPQTDSEGPFPACLFVKDSKGRQLELLLGVSQARAVKEKLESFIHAADSLALIKEEVCPSEKTV